LIDYKLQNHLKHDYHYNYSYIIMIFCLLCIYIFIVLFPFFHLLFVLSLYDVSKLYYDMIMG
jgi:hypothetical protein